MPRMLSSEIFLISFVVSLWLLSVIICLKRYSLFICHHKRDVPFYDASLINVKLNLTGESSASQDLKNTSQMIQHTSSSKSIVRPTSPTPNHTKSSCICDIEEKGGGPGGGSNPAIHWNAVNNSSSPTICAKCNLLKTSMSTNLYSFNKPFVIDKGRKSFSNGNFYKNYYANYQSGGPYSNLMKNRYHLDFSNDYFYNGVMYPNQSRTTSSLMSKVIRKLSIIPK